MEDYKILWTDMHSNLHHEQIKNLPVWLNHIKKIMDFWPIAYYPYAMRKYENNFAVEDINDLEEIERDWEYIRMITNEANAEGFPMFMGYEWQGAGLDGDHNVFFKNNDENMVYPMRYENLKKIFQKKEVIAIPHHLAYQPEHRGKNWKTHDDKFSPFVEIYSSHGSSENDENPIEMKRHVHMGPRTGITCVERGWENGNQFGVIASGDNHSCPGVYGFGYCAVLSKSNSKEDIWDAFVNRRVYGVSKERMLLDYTVDGVVMGGMVERNKEATLFIDIEGADAIDRIEIIQDNIVSEMIPHTSTWERKKLEGKICFKFQLELGWGPDRRIFPDIESKCWKGKLYTSGKLVSVEKCWSNFGQELKNQTENGCEFELTSYKTTATGKWMGPSMVTTEGFIFEIEDDIDSNITLVIDDKTYVLAIRDILYSSKIIPLLEDVSELLEERHNFKEFYRSDPWWHNCYKIKIGKGIPKEGYHVQIQKKINTMGSNHVRIRAWQKNGGVLWSSPIFMKGTKDNV